MQKQTHEGRVIVWSATNGVESDGFPNVHAYEGKKGSFMFDAFMAELKKPRKVPCNFTEAFNDVKEKVILEARKHNLSQRPLMKVFGPADTETLMFQQTFMDLHTILIVCPSYDQKNLPEGQTLKALPGAIDDMNELLIEIEQGRVLPRNCKVIVAGDIYKSLYRLPNLDVVRATQENCKELVLKTLASEGNVAVFLFGHGMQDTNEGRRDEYMVFPQSKREQFKNRLWGLDVARALVTKVGEREGITILFADLCYSFGFPDQDDIKIAIDEYQRARMPEPEGLCGLEQYSLQPPPVENDFKPTAPIMEVSGLAEAPACVARANSFNPGHLVQAVPPPPRPPLEAIPPTQETVSIAQVVCPAPAIPVEPSTPVNDDADASGTIQARGVDPEVVASFASITRDLLNNISIAWHGLETTCGYLFGAGVLSLLTPLLIAAFLVMAGAALWLYLHYMVRNETRTLFPMLVVMALSTLLPYLCDPATLQSFFAVDNAICFGLCCTAASFVVLLVSVAADWGKLSSQVSALFKATNLASKYALIARLALEIHLMGGGRAIQQSIHVRAGGVDSFVVYYPLMDNGTSQFCAVPLRNNKFKLLPSRTGFTVFDKELDDGSRADLTCQYAVFQSRVAFRARGDVHNVKAWAFNNGQDVIDFKDLHLDTKYLERAVFNVNTTESGEDALLGRVALVGKLDAAWKTKGKHFPIQLPTMAKRTPPTLLEWIAAPVFFAVEKLVGVSLWAFRPRGARPAREL